jgi:hypothetical protein
VNAVVTDISLGTIASVLGAIASCAAVLIAAGISDKANELSTRANSIANELKQIALASIEQSVRAEIRSSFEFYHSSALRSAELLAKLDAEKHTPLVIEATKQTVLSAAETWLNSYEIACSLYRGDKLDKIRFKTDYQMEIKRIFDTVKKDPLLSPLLDPPEDSQFRALIAVYGEWTD